MDRRATGATAVKAQEVSEEEALLERAKDYRKPAHMAIIPDGNRRWADEQGLSPVEGHRAGFEVAKKLSRFCRRLGLHTVTVWAFSTENWRRPPVEVAALMALFEEWLRDLLPEAIEEGVRVIHIGRRDGLPDGAGAHAEAAGFPDGLAETLKDAITEIEEKTASFENNIINLAINYGGADEVQRATIKLIEHARATGVDPASLQITDFLDTVGQPHPLPDLIWRTSGELRLSGFMPLQSSYAEFAFTPKHFPDLDRVDVVDAVEEYSRRLRRFGG
jgi:undecaprenyl diphosphate synthase